MMRARLPAAILFSGAALALLLAGAAPGAAAPHHAPAPSFITHHLIEAEVSGVDREAGLLLIKTDAGRLKLHAPRGVGGSLRKGDDVLVDVTLIHHPDPALVPRDTDGPRPLFVERFAAEVIGVQRSLGVVTLATAAGRLIVTLPEAASAGLRTGDRLPLDLAVHLPSDLSAMPSAKRDRKTGLAGLLFLIFGHGKQE